MVRHCGLCCNHLLRHQSKCWECTFQMRYNCHYLESIHTYDPGSHNIQTRRIHLSCLLFHHLLSTFQRTHHFYNKVLCLNKTFLPTNRHICSNHCIPTIEVCIPTSLHNHHQTGNNHIRTFHLDTDNGSHPNYHHSPSNHRIQLMMALCTLVKV